MSEGRKSRRRSRRGWATPLVLVALASAGAACGRVGSTQVGVGTVSAGSCEHLVATVRTSETSYAPGQTVIISVTQANEGPACDAPPPPCGLPPFASAYNSAGEDVWDYGASKTLGGPPLCLPGPAPSTAWPARYSHTQVLDWSQDTCRDGAGQWGHANPNCPGTQVPAGTYRIVGGNGPSASATITISRTRPAPAG
jgi:hypothetical protein